MKTIREKIWYFLLDSKTNQYLAESIVKYYQKRDLILNLFLLITTSSSITAWAVWKELPILWAIIIGVSQVITIAKPYFLFPKYIKIFNEKSIYWQQLSIEIEELWVNTNYSHITEEESSVKYFELKRKSMNFDSLPDDIIFFTHNNLQSIAEEKCNIYLNKI
jgi:hypothetical protein